MINRKTRKAQLRGPSGGQGVVAIPGRIPGRLCGPGMPMFPAFPISIIGTTPIHVFLP